MKWLLAKLALSIVCFYLYRSNQDMALWTSDSPSESDMYQHNAGFMLGISLALLSTTIVDVLLRRNNRNN